MQYLHTRSFTKLSTSCGQLQIFIYSFPQSKPNSFRPRRQPKHKYTMEQIRFGVELEMVVRPKLEALKILTEYYDFYLTPYETDDDVDDNTAEIIDFLRTYFNQAGIPTNPEDQEIDEETDYSRWTITTDPSINDGGGCYGIEVISPVFVSNFGSETSQGTGPWQEGVYNVLKSIEKYFDIVTDDRHGCATHVHISPVQGSNAPLVRRCARFLVCEDQTLTNMLPETQKRNSYSRPNFSVRPRPDLAELTENLSINQMVDMMMPRNSDMGR